MITEDNTEDTTTSDLTETITTSIDSTPTEDSVVETAPMETEALDTPSEAIVETPAYEANLAYNFRKEERQIPEAFKSFIKDEESNNLIKELYEKADATDFLKESREIARQRLAEYETNSTPRLQKLGDIEHFLKEGNVGTAMEVAGISREQIINEAVRYLEQEQNPQGAQQPNNELAIRERDLIRRQEVLESQLAQQTQHQLYSEYDNATQVHAGSINAYDSKFGSNSFQSMVATYGQQQESLGRNLSVSDAVNEVVERYNLQSFSAPQTDNSIQPQHNNQQSIPATKTFPAITTGSSGSTSSPVAKNIKSFDDLVALSESI